MLAAHRNIVNLVELDDTLDAAIMCTVGRRASVAQGRALLSIWDRSFSSALPAGASIASVQALKDFTVLLRGTSSTAVSNDLPLASAHLGPLFGAIACILGMTLEQTAYVFMLSHVKALLSAAVRASIFGPYHAQKLLASVEVQQGIQRVLASAHLGPLFGAIACILGMTLEQTAYVFMLSHVKALLSAAVRASIFGPYHAQKLLASVEVQQGIQRVIDQEWNTSIEDAGQSVPVMDLWIGRHEMLYSRIFNS